MKASLGVKKMGRALANDNVSAEISEEALSMLISAFGDSSLRAVQDCVTAMDEWDKLQARYDGKMLINKQAVQNSSLNLKLRRGEQIRDHNAKMETEFS